ncbi:hypothetical protein Tco_1131336 [Tanacetum coccineum]
MEELQVRDSNDNEEQTMLHQEMKELLTRGEILWRQRNRIQWLKEGDKNTRFFHSRASARRQRNNINKLRNENGVWVADEEGISTLVASYFTNLFTSSNPVNCDATTTTNLPIIHTFFFTLYKM